MITPQAAHTLRCRYLVHRIRHGLAPTREQREKLERLEELAWESIGGGMVAPPEERAND